MPRKTAEEKLKEIEAKKEAESQRHRAMKKQYATEIRQIKALQNKENKKKRDRLVYQLGETISKQLNGTDLTTLTDDDEQALTESVTSTYGMGKALMQDFGDTLPTHDPAALTAEISAMMRRDKTIEDRFQRPLEQITEQDLDRIIALGLRVEQNLGVAVSALTAEQIEAVMQHIDSQSGFMRRRAGLQQY